MNGVSVVVPAHNAARTLGLQLEALRHQSTSFDFEVIVVDNMSSDSTRAVADGFQREDSRFRVVEAADRPGVNHARNTGVRHAAFEFIVFCDADDQVQGGWVDAMARAFDAGHEAVGGALDRFRDGVHVGTTGLQDHLWPGRPTPSGANCGTSRRLHQELGGFDERFRGGGDETEYFWRAHLRGYPCVFVADAVVRYEERASTGDLLRQRYAYGRSHIVLQRMFRDAGMPPVSVGETILAVVRACVVLVLPGAAKRGFGDLALGAGRVRERLRRARRPSRADSPARDD